MHRFGCVRIHSVRCFSAARSLNANVGFIGLGNMGAPMARNLLKAGHKVTVFDLNAASSKKLGDAGAHVAAGAQQVLDGNSVVVSMLPSSPHVKEVQQRSATQV